MDTKTHCLGYDGACYQTLEADTSRTNAYRAAIAQHVPGRIVLDIGTGARTPPRFACTGPSDTSGGLALLALMAAQAGAKRVYALETNPEAAAAARESVHASGLQHVVTIIEGAQPNLYFRLSWCYTQLAAGFTTGACRL